jgi:hypothetical protein
MDINDPQLSKMYFLLNGYILHSTLFITEFWWSMNYIFK